VAETAADRFQERQKRFDDAIRLDTPDRVPLELSFGYFPAKYCGIRYDASYYDYDAWLAACKQTVADFGVDISSVQPFFPGAVLDLVDPQVLCWPGRDGADIQSHQYLDGEHMGEYEYAHLLRNPTEFLLTRYMPRVAGAMKGFGSIGALPTPHMGYHSVIALAEALSSPGAAASLEVLVEIGREMSEWRPKLEAFAREFDDLGLPTLSDSVALAPYDVLADHLRGMRGTMMDLYNHPDELQA
jgi:hypothetical protein